MNGSIRDDGGIEETTNNQNNGLSIDYKEFIQVGRRRNIKIVCVGT
jgi:hypothetical protein